MQVFSGKKPSKKKEDVQVPCLITGGDPMLAEYPRFSKFAQFFINIYVIFVGQLPFFLIGRAILEDLFPSISHISYPVFFKHLPIFPYFPYDFHTASPFNHQDSYILNGLREHLHRKPSIFPSS